MSDLGAIAKDVASAVARGGEKGGKAIVEHYKSIGEGLLKSSALHKEVENDAAKSIENIGRGGAKDLEHDASQAGRDAERDGAQAARKDLADGGAQRDLEGAGARPGASSSHGECQGEGDPVDVASGDVIFSETDVTLPGVLPLVLERAHRSSTRTGRWFGRSWMSSFDQRLRVTPDRIIGAFADGRVLTWTYPNGASGSSVTPVSGPVWPLRHDPDGCYSVNDPRRGLTWRFGHPDGYETAEGDESELPLVSVTDRAGHEIAFRYDADGRPLSVAHSGGYLVQVATADGHVTGLTLAGRDGEDDMPLRQFTYDDEGNLSGVVNSSGLPMRFTYDAAGRMTSWTDRNGHFYRYAFDDQGRCVSGDGSDGALSGTFAYEPGITRWTDADGAVTTYEITDSGRVAAITDPLGNVTRCEYDSRSNLVTYIDPLGRITRYAWDDHGNLLSATNPDGSEISVEYDDRSLPVLLTGQDGSTWRQGHDERGNRTLLEAPDGTVTTFGYDDLGHLATATGPDGALTSVGCNAAGLPVEVTDPNGIRTRQEIDAFGRVVRVTDPDDGITSLSWTTEGMLASRVFPDGATETWEWDGEANLARHISPTGAVTSYGYGSFYKITEMRWPDGSRNEFVYDHQLRLTRVVHAGLTWSYEYDPAGRLLTETDYNGAATTYQYDAAGQLTRQANAAGQEITYSYDPLGNPAERTAGGVVTAFGYDPVGRVIWARNPDADLRIERDALGRITAETCNGRTVSTSYNPVGRIVGRRTPSGVTSVWELDQAGRPATLTVGTHQLRFGYDREGREVLRQLPGGLTLTQEWNPRGHLASQSLADAETRVQRRDYHYRADGLPERIDDLLAGNRTLSLDASGRVTSVTGPDWTERYAYDQAGVITAAGLPAPPAGAGASWADAQSQEYRQASGTLVARAGSIRYRHDAVGRVVSRTRTRISRKPDKWSYEWDAYSRLTAVTTPDGTSWQYRYDPFGRRISKRHVNADGEILGETLFAWDGFAIAEQSDITGDREHVTTWDYHHGTLTPLAQTCHPSGQDVSQEQIDQQFYSIITDLIGTPTELVSQDGILTGHQRQTLWGTTAWDPDGAATPLRFPGQYEDPETGLHYNNQRYYDPVSGTYLSPDPLGLTPAPNPHTYVTNPYVEIDPLGLMCGPGEPVGQRVLFGQARVDEHFSRKPEVPDYLKGRSIKDVSDELSNGTMSPDQIHIDAFEHNGQLVSTNTRGLSALSDAGLRPTNVTVLPKEAVSRSVRARLREISALGDRLPSTRIAVTPSIKDKTVIRTISIP